MPMVAELCRRRNTSNPQYCHRYLALCCALGFLRGHRAERLSTPATERATLQRSVMRCPLRYKWLAVDAAEKGLWPWQLLTRHHFCEHISEASAYLNPKIGRAYQYEHTVRNIWRAAAAQYRRASAAQIQACVACVIELNRNRKLCEK